MYSSSLVASVFSTGSTSNVASVGYACRQARISHQVSSSCRASRHHRFCRPYISPPSSGCTALWHITSLIPLSTFADRRFRNYTINDRANGATLLYFSILMKCCRYGFDIFNNVLIVAFHLSLYQERSQYLADTFGFTLVLTKHVGIFLFSHPHGTY